MPRSHHKNTSVKNQHNIPLPEASNSIEIGLKKSNLAKAEDKDFQIASVNMLRDPNIFITYVDPNGVGEKEEKIKKKREGMRKKRRGGRENKEKKERRQGRREGGLEEGRGGRDEEEREGGCSIIKCY